MSRAGLPLLLATSLAASGVAVMVALPGSASTTPGTYAASATAEGLRISSLDQDLSGDPQSLDLALAQAKGDTATSTDPRAAAAAANLVGTPTPSGQKLVTSQATSTNDTTTASYGSGAAGTLTNELDYGTASVTARGRWTGDDTCIPATTPFTSSRTVSAGGATPPSSIPSGTPGSGIPTELPTLPSEFPTTPPTDFPTGLPTDLPTPSIPTEIPTSPLTSPTGSISVPISLPTESISVPISLPTDSISIPLRAADRMLPASTERATGPVSLASIAPFAVQESTGLGDFGTVGNKEVTSDATATVTDSTKPAMTFFGTGSDAEVGLVLDKPAHLSAYSTGTTNGSQVTWEPPSMKLVVDSQDYTVPADGSALSVPYSDNSDVVLTVAAGKLSSAESADGTLAQATVNTLDVLITNGSKVVFQGGFFPLSVKATSPVGGVQCPTVQPPVLKSPKLVLKGKDNGPKADKLAVSAITAAARGKATVYRVTHHKKHKITTKRLDAKGDRVFKLKDKNGKKKTVYLVKLLATKHTKAASAKKKLG